MDLICNLYLRWDYVTVVPDCLKTAISLGSLTYIVTKPSSPFSFQSISPNPSLWSSCIKGSNSRMRSGAIDFGAPVSYITTTCPDDFTIGPNSLDSLSETMWRFPNVLTQIMPMLLVGSVDALSSLSLESIWQRMCLSNLISPSEVKSCQIQPRPRCTYSSLSGKLEQNRVRSPCHLWLPYLNSADLNTISRYRWNWEIICTCDEGNCLFRASKCRCTYLNVYLRP